MKANIETLEPVVRPGSASKAVTSAALRSLRTPAFVPARAEATLFHAWRA